MNAWVKTLAVITAGCTMIPPTQRNIQRIVDKSSIEIENLQEEKTIIPLVELGTYEYSVECLGQKLGTAVVSYAPYSAERGSIINEKNEKLKTFFEHHTSKGNAFIYEDTENNEDYVVGSFSFDLTHCIVKALEGVLFQSRSYETLCKKTSDGLIPLISLSQIHDSDSIDAVIFEHDKNLISFYECNNKYNNNKYNKKPNSANWIISAPEEVMKQTYDPVTIISRLTSMPITAVESEKFLGYYPFNRSLIPVTIAISPNGEESVKGCAILQPGMFFDNASVALGVAYSKDNSKNYDDLFRVPMRGTLEITYNGITAYCKFEKFTPIKKK